MHRSSYYMHRSSYYHRSCYYLLFFLFFYISFQWNVPSASASSLSKLLASLASFETKNFLCFVLICNACLVILFSHSNERFHSGLSHNKFFLRALASLFPCFFCLIVFQYMFHKIKSMFYFVYDCHLCQLCLLMLIIHLFHLFYEIIF